MRGSQPVGEMRVEGLRLMNSEEEALRSMLLASSNFRVQIMALFLLAVIPSRFAFELLDIEACHIFRCAVMVTPRLIPFVDKIHH